MAFNITRHVVLGPACAALIALAMQGAALAQSPADTVAWTLTAPSADSVKPGARVVLKLQGVVLDGWHVYALKQLPGGPTPLRVALDPSDVAASAGAPAGSPTIKVRDPSFNLDTEYYSKPFSVTVPVRIGAKAAAGKQSIPVSVRFQTCNGEICHPPKTVKLSAPVTVQGNG